MFLIINFKIKMVCKKLLIKYDIISILNYKENKHNKYLVYFLKKI